MYRSLLPSLFCCLCFVVAQATPSFAQGFSSLKAASQGFGASGEKKDEKGGKNGSSKIDKSYRDAGPLGVGTTAGLNDVVFLGVFETYLTKQRLNARFSLYAEPKEFGFAHRACKKIIRLRDGVNTHLFMNPPKVDDRGRIDPTGMEPGLQEAIQKSLRSEIPYFNKLHIVSGRYSIQRAPKELKGLSISDCEGVMLRAKENNGA